MLIQKDFLSEMSTTFKLRDAEIIRLSNVILGNQKLVRRGFRQDVRNHNNRTDFIHLNLTLSLQRLASKFEIVTKKFRKFVAVIH